MKTKTPKSYARTSGGIFNLGHGQVSSAVIDAEFAATQKDLNALPNGKHKTTLVQRVGNLYGYVKSIEWCQGFISPVEA